AVAVGERRDAAVGTMTVERELAGPGEALVECRRNVEAEPPGVLTESDERAQHDVVIVRRAFALDAVAEDVGQQIAGDRVGREPQQPSAGIEIGQRQRRGEQRVELERAMIALPGQVSLEVPQLFAKTDGDRYAEPGRQRVEIEPRGEATPRVDPVLD